MKPTLLAALILSLGSVHLAGQPSVVLKRDNDVPAKSYAGFANWEETVMFVPDGPCRVLEVQIYLSGSTPNRDTIYVVGDPSEGAVPPTGWVLSYNRIALFEMVYDGTPGWKTIDLRSRNIRSDGYDRIVLQHKIEATGAVWMADNAQSAPYGSFLMNPGEQSGLGFPGKYYLAEGDFMVRLVVEYDFPEGEGSAPPPPATMRDATKFAGITNDAGEVLTSARVSVADWNNDGWDDLAVGSRFYRNNRNGSFSPVNTGIPASASVWGDYDNDGDLDCFAAQGGTNNDALYRNNGDGSFTDVTAASGINNPAPTVTPIWFDMNRDGKLDLFISNGRTGDFPNEIFYRDRMYLGNGDETFDDVTDVVGIPQGEPAPNYDCWGAAPADYNGDGRTDIFVATYRLAPDLLYRNDETTSFTEVGSATGVLGEPTAEPTLFGHGIGADWADYNNDGLIDLTVGNLGHPDWRGQVSNPSLVYRNEGGPNYRFTEVHHDLGVKFFEMNAGVVWGDFDLDGYQDLLHCQYAYQADGTNGEPRRRSRLYLNQGPGEDWRLSDVTWHTGLDIHGAWTAARLDYDRDGDLDLIVASPTDALRLYRNDMERKGRPIGFRLVGDKGMNVATDAYGTRVTVRSNGVAYFRELQGGGSGATATQHSNLLHFGVGDVEAVDSVIVQWPNGTRDVFTNLATDREYRLQVGGEGPEVIHSYVLSVNERDERDGPAGGSISLSDARFEEGAFRFDVRTIKAADLRLEVVNAAGEIVATRLLRNVEAGSRTLSIDATLPGGIYLLRVSNGTDVASAKVRVVR